MSVPETKAEMPKPPTGDPFTTTFNEGGFFRGQIPDAAGGTIVKASLVKLAAKPNRFDNNKLSLEWEYVPEGFNQEEHGTLRKTTGLAMLPEGKATLPPVLAAHKLTFPTQDCPSLLKANGVDTVDKLIAKATVNCRLFVEEATSQQGKKYLKVVKVMAA